MLTKWIFVHHQGAYCWVAKTTLLDIFYITLGVSNTYLLRGIYLYIIIRQFATTFGSILGLFWDYFVTNWFPGAGTCYPVRSESSKIWLSSQVNCWFKITNSAMWKDEQVFWKCGILALKMRNLLRAAPRNQGFLQGYLELFRRRLDRDGLLVRFDGDLMVILCWFDGDLMVIWWWFDADLMLIWWWFDADLMVIWCWFDADLMLIWWWFYADFMLIWWWFDADLMLIWCWFLYCLTTVLWLFWVVFWWTGRVPRTTPTNPARFVHQKRWTFH